MSSIVIAGDTSGSVTLQAPAVAGSSVLTLPAVTDTVAGIAATQTLTNKTLTSPTIASANLTTALTLAGAAGTNGQVLTSAGSGLPSWTTISGSSQWTTTGSDIYYNTGKVGIGTSTPTALMHTYSSGSNATNYIESASTTGYSILHLKNSGTSGRGFEIGVGGSSATSPYAGQLYFYDLTASSLRMFLTTSGNLQLQNNLSVGGVTPSTSGSGITFPATQSASSDANTLDDYEEGTFTPTLVSQTGSLTAVNVGTGNYIKIGTLVTIMCRPVITTNGTGGTAIFIGGFPFARAGTGGFGFGGGGREDAIVGWAFCFSEQSTTSVYVSKYDATYAGGNGHAFPILITYRTT